MNGYAVAQIHEIDEISALLGRRRRSLPDSDTPGHN